MFALSYISHVLNCLPGSLLMASLRREGATGEGVPPRWKADESFPPAINGAHLSTFGWAAPKCDLGGARWRSIQAALRSQAPRCCLAANGVVSKQPLEARCRRGFNLFCHLGPAAAAAAAAFYDSPTATWNNKQKKKKKSASRRYCRRFAAICGLVRRDSIQAMIRWCGDEWEPFGAIAAAALLHYRCSLAGDWLCDRVLNTLIPLSPPSIADWLIDFNDNMSKLPAGKNGGGRGGGGATALTR